MSAPATLQTIPTPARPTQLALCLAQRAFAALIDHATSYRGPGLALRSAQLRSKAQRTLPALSADDRSHLARWLALQFAARDGGPGSYLLARVDAMLCARTLALVARTRKELTTRSRDGSGAVA